MWREGKKVEWWGKNKTKFENFIPISQNQHLMTTHNYFELLQNSAIHRKCAISSLLLSIHRRIL
jgi:hypothetical protein